MIKDPAVKEVVVLLEKYFDNCIEFSLTTKFLCDVRDFIIKFLNTFDKRSSGARKARPDHEWTESLMSKLQPAKNTSFICC